MMPSLEFIGSVFLHWDPATTKRLLFTSKVSYVHSKNYLNLKHVLNVYLPDVNLKRMKITRNVIFTESIFEMGLMFVNALKQPVYLCWHCQCVEDKSNWTCA